MKDPGRHNPGGSQRREHSNREDPPILDLRELSLIFNVHRKAAATIKTTADAFDRKYGTRIPSRPVYVRITVSLVYQYM